jgi:hypothetical protein
MNARQRTVIMTEMHGRDLLRRHVALALLLALPLCFYVSAVSQGGRYAVPSGAIGMAFAVSGAALFSALSALAVDQRLVLSGYRPAELLAARLLFLGGLAVAVAAGFATLMSAVSHPARPVLLGVAVAVVGLQAVPFGLAVAAVVPRELEGTLLVIGVVGMQIAAHPNTWLARVLPFYGPRRLVDAAVSGSGGLLVPALLALAYGAALLIVGELFGARRLSARPRRGPRGRGQRRSTYST